MLELEKTYLVRNLPAGLEKCASEKLSDCYLPLTSAHPKLRLRQRGGRYEITKKEPVAGDASEQEETTIELTAEEYAAFATVAGKRLCKRRYCYPCGDITAEIDVFEGDLRGLVMADFEFTGVQEKAAFTPPDWCLCEVTEEDFIAGGRICGKKYADLAGELERFGYERILS